MFTRDAPPRPKAQIRCKKDIAEGALRLFPYGGAVIPQSEMEVNLDIKKNLFSLPDGYLMGVRLTAKSKNDHGLQPAPDFCIVSPMGDSIIQKQQAPYWAVVLADNKSQTMKVNMAASSQVYICSTGKHDPSRCQARPMPLDLKGELQVELPVFHNCVPLHEGDILVLPTGGGHIRLISKDDFAATRK